MEAANIVDREADAPPRPLKRKSAIWAAILSIIWPGLGHVYGQSYRLGARLALAMLFWLLGIVALFQVETVSVVSFAATLAWVAIFPVLIVCAAAHAFVTLRRRPFLPRPRWFRSAWVTVPLALAVAQGFTEALPHIRAWRVFNTPSSSMAPTIRVGDHLVAELHAYRHRPVERGEVVVFLHPRYRVDYVKRVIGLPGDRVQMRAGRLLVNGTEIPREPIGRMTLSADGRNMILQQYQLTLPEGRQFTVLKTDDSGPLNNTREYEVPAGAVFVLGDYLDNSLDSRMFGPVPLSDVVGRAALIYWSDDRDRIGTTIN